MTPIRCTVVPLYNPYREPLQMCDTCQILIPIKLFCIFHVWLQFSAPGCNTVSLSNAEKIIVVFTTIDSCTAYTLVQSTQIADCWHTSIDPWFPKPTWHTAPRQPVVLWWEVSGVLAYLLIWTQHDTNRSQDHHRGRARDDGGQL
jgi:hypothetical protein